MSRLAPTMLIAMISLGGCVPVPHHADVARSKGIERKRPKIEFLKEGITTKSELFQELGDFDTDASEGRFFWGRWEQANTRIDYPPTIFQDTFWSRRNLLAVFDTNDVVIQFCACSDDSLIGCLHRMLDHLDAPADLGDPLRLSASRPHALWPVDGTAVFENGTVAFSERDKPKSKFILPISAIADVITGGYLGYPDWSTVSLTVHFKRGTAPTDHLVLRAYPKETLRLIWRLRYAGTSTGASE
jgi:hypothetical protein